MYIFTFHKVKAKRTTHWDDLIAISPQGLEHCIRLIRACGFHIVNPRELFEHEDPLAKLPANSCLITFDDGYEDFYTAAAPVLKRMQCPSINFLVASRMAGTNAWDAGDLPVEQQEPLMTWDQARHLAEDPLFTFGSHGLWHVRMAEAASDAQLLDEINGSYTLLQQELGDGFLPAFAYPWGSYNKHVLELMAQSEFRYSFTIEHSEWTPTFNPHEIPRYCLRYRDGYMPWFFARMLIKIKMLRLGMTSKPFGVPSPIPLPGLVPNTGIVQKAS